jgi:hypothetical protein
MLDLQPIRTAMENSPGVWESRTNGLRRRQPSSRAPLLGPSPLRTGRETFVLIRLRPFERLFQGDAGSIRKGVGDEPCRGTLDGAGRGFLRSWNHPSQGSSSALPHVPICLVLSREAPQGSLPAFASGDVVDATDATGIYSVTEQPSLSP